MRPIALAEPEPAMPTTRVANSRGAMIDLIMRMKMFETGVRSLAWSGKKWPKAMPTTMAIKIQLVRESFFIVHPI